METKRRGSEMKTFLDIMISRKAVAPMPIKVELKNKVLAARSSYLEVENFVKDFIKNFMPNILDASLEKCTCEDGTLMYFVSWDEKIEDCGIVKFRSIGISDFEVAMKLYNKKLMIMEM